MSVRAPVGTLNIAMEDCCIGRGLAALNSKFGSQLHLLYTLSGFKQLFDVMDGNGTTFGSITKDTLFEMKVVIPRRDQIKSFEEMVQPIEKVIDLLESGENDIEVVQETLDEAVCGINDLQEEFDENDSEIETVARECIAATVAYILEWFGIPIDTEEAIRERDW